MPVILRVSDESFQFIRYSFISVSLLCLVWLSLAALTRSGFARFIV